MLGRKKRKEKKTTPEAPAPQAAGGAPEGDAPPLGEPGSRVGRYTIESTLGQGGMGRVFLARDPVIGRNVALKIISIRPDLPPEEAAQYRERFLREAQAAGALIHPNIVAVHDIGKDPVTDSPYIVMEHVPGQDLKKVILARAPMPGPEAVGIVLQIASALDYAHRRGIVHRDVKPANVLITEQGRVKITDFGVARLPDSDLTRSDQFVGSPGFMSPEQLKGGPVDGRSDLFALGVILYELLTGKAPFQGESVSEVLYRISTQPAEPPSEALQDVSPDFDPILEKALAKDPETRFQTGQEMIAALSVLLPEEPQAAAAHEDVAVDAGLPSPASPWFTLTSQWRLGALVAFLILVLVGVNWGIVSLFHGPLAKSLPLDDDPGPPAVAGLGRAPAGPAGSGAGPDGAPRGSIRAARRDLATMQETLGAANAPETLRPDRAVPAVCAMSYVSPGEAARILEAVRGSPRGAAAAAGFASGDHPTGRIRVEVKHRMKSGRLVVLVDGRTVLSKPFEASKGKSGTVTHVLSVPAGKHGVEVRLLADRGALAAKSKIKGTVTKDRVVFLTGEQRSGPKKDLELDWGSSH